jgi:hypothetical protein
MNTKNEFVLPLFSLFLGLASFILSLKSFCCLAIALNSCTTRCTLLVCVTVKLYLLLLIVFLMYVRILRLRNQGLRDLY